MERFERTARTRKGFEGHHGFDPYAQAEQPDVPAWDVFDLPASAIEALRGEIGILRERLATAAPKRAVTEMDRAITLLSRRVDDLREAGATREGSDQAILDELASIRGSLGEVGRNERFAERFKVVESGIDALGRKIDLLGARAVDPVEVARLQSQMGEMRDLVQRLVTGPQGQDAMAKLAQRLGACAESVALAGEQAAQRLTDAAGDFERNADALLRRFADLEARGRVGDAEATERLRASLLESVNGVHARLDRMSGQIADQAASVSPALGLEISQRLGAIAARLAAAEESGRPGSSVVDAMERHLSGLSDQLRETHDRLGRLDEIETGLRRLSEEVRNVREDTRSVANEAAAAVAAKVSDNPDGAAVLGLKRGLAALEARQDEMERRAGELMAAELEQQLDSISVALDQEGDGTYAPRSAAGRAPAQDAAHEAAYEEATYQEAAYQDAGYYQEPSYEEAPQPHATTYQEPEFQPAPEIRAEDAAPQPQRRASGDATEADPLESALRAAATDVPWPRPNRRVDWGTPPAHAKEAEEERPRLEKRARKTEKARERRPHTPGVFAGLFARRRHIAMVALIAGATTVFTGLSVGMAVRNGPEIVTGLTEALRRLAAPAIAGVAPTELPPAIGPSALQTAARDGDPAAAFLVAGRYAEGRGTDVDLDAATKWLGYAVQRGSAPAALRLGALYESAGKDMGEARRFYTWAAEQGNVRAMHALAMLLSEGTLPDLNGKPDWAGALKWFRTAADLGHRDSQYNLGVIYARGLGVSADAAEAWKWLDLAARQGDEDSARKRDILSRDADPAVLAKAQQASAAFVPATPVAAANTVTIKPEWQEQAPDVVASAAPAKAATRVASSAGTAH
ncbi:hypothetical protein V5F29_01550 [Xanthobacter aminoxidans]|uniref:hypothetical protein n=1 Tax=Xanthobacter aminoxidans TaxID=186280 RepID=UPI00372CB6A8